MTDYLDPLLTQYLPKRKRELYLETFAILFNVVIPSQTAVVVENCWKSIGLPGCSSSFALSRCEDPDMPENILQLVDGNIDEMVSDVYDG